MIKPEIDVEKEFDHAIIQADQYVMIRLPSENFRVVKLQADAVLGLGKFGSFRVNDILGHPFGYTYEILGDKNLKIISDQFDLDDDENEVNEGNGVEDITNSENNRELLDDPSTQTLSMQEIEELKKQSTDAGREIIDKVVKSHTAFNKKTMFSQEKYLKRKQQKYLRQFTPLAIGSNELVDIYIDKDAHKVLGASVETIGLMMSLANIRPGGKYLVVDEMSGVLISAMMERMGGQGLIVCVHENEHASIDALKYMNYSETLVAEMVKTINFLDYFHPEQCEAFEEVDASELSKLKSYKRSQYYKKKKKTSDYQLIRQLADEQGFDGLLVATTLNTVTLMPLLIPAVAGSRPIVVYNESKEALVATTHVFKNDLRVLGPTLMETRVRKYQTLPGRMHPHMTMRGGGGYVLWGTRVFPTSVNAVGVRSSKRRKIADDTKSLPSKSDETVKSN